MRLWSIHPSYLDPQGLVALWREALLAREVLRGNTKGYRHHPQLQRFREHAAPVAAINAYLAAIHAEALVRGYGFDSRKLVTIRRPIRLRTTTGQLLYECEHLRRKLRTRNPAYYRLLNIRRADEPPRAHPVFTVIEGAVQDWERGVLQGRT